MKFADVIQVLLDGKRATKKEWADKRHYVLLQDYILVIHKAGEAEETTRPWILSENDLVGEDWEIV